MPRCNDKESEAADALSKCDFDRAFENIKNREEEPMRIPSANVRNDNKSGMLSETECIL